MPPSSPQMWSAHRPCSPGQRAIAALAWHHGSRVFRWAPLTAVTRRPVLPPAVADRKPPSPGGKAPDGLGSLHGLPIPASTS